MAAPLVVDAAVVAKWRFVEAGSEAALALFGAWASGRVDLIAPDVLIAELGALCRRKARAGDATAADAVAAQALLHGCLPALVSAAELAESALLLALRHDRPYAEALHLALAVREGCPYVTADDRLLRLLAPAFPCVRHLGDVETLLRPSR